MPSPHTALTSHGRWRLALATALAFGGLGGSPSPVSAAPDACSPVEVLSGPLAPLPTDAPEAAPAPGHPTGLVMHGRDWRAGAGWWALVCAGEAPQCALHPTRLHVRNVLLQERMSDGPGELGQHLRWAPLPNGLDRVALARDDAKPGRPFVLALFHTTSKHRPAWLRAGRVTTWLQAGMPSTAYAPPTTANWTTGHLAVVIPTGEAKPPLLVPGVASRGSNQIDLLQLRHRGQRQQLDGYWPETTDDPNNAESAVLDPTTYLRWAGDIDGDGLPDLLLAHRDTETALYLSSMRDGADQGVGTPPRCLNHLAVDTPLLGVGAAAAHRR